MNEKPNEKEEPEQERKISLRAGLYLVATPIGNLRDITLRALDILRSADVIACEDTRVTGKLLKAYGIETKMVVYNDHSDSGVRAQILSRIEGGDVVALVSDAGMPMISDPGHKLVQEAIDSGVYVTSAPGANAALMGVQLSGLYSEAFCFIGFLPSKSEARRKRIALYQDVLGAVIAYETAPRLLKALKDIESVCGSREVAVARELSKMYEEVRRGSVAELIAHYEEAGAPKGEIVLVIAPGAAQEFSDEDLKAMLKDAMETQRTKDAAGVVAAKTGVSKSRLYDMALKL